MKNRIGLGLDYQHRKTFGMPFHDFMRRNISSLSHVSIVGVQTEADAEYFTSLCGGLPIIHHFTGVAPGGVGGVNLKELRAQLPVTGALGAMWCLEDIGIWNIGPYNIPYFAPPVLCEEVLDSTVDGILQLQREMSVPFLAELPSCSLIAGEMSLEEFFTRLTSAANCGMVLDVSHVFSYAIYRGISGTDMLSRLPLDKVIEIHVAGGNVHAKHTWRYLDNHTDPIQAEVLRILSHVVPQCQNLRAITYEIGAGIASSVMDDDLARLNMIAADAKFVPFSAELSNAL